MNLTEIFKNKKCPSCNKEWTVSHASQRVCDGCSIDIRKDNFHTNKYWTLSKETDNYIIRWHSDSSTPPNIQCQIIKKEIRTDINFELPLNINEKKIKSIIKLGVFL